MSREIEMRIAAVAARQHGAVTQRQLLEAGLSTGGIARRLRWGRIRRLHRGVYLAAPFPLQHTAEMAAALATPGGALSHVSSGILWEVTPAASRIDGVEVSVVGNRGRQPGIIVHRVARLGPEERTSRHGIPVTSVARTLVDLGAVLDLRELESAIARAERARLITREALERLPLRYRRHAGVAGLKAVLERPGGAALTRSAAEEAFLALTRAAALPVPECNVRVGGYEVDFYWRAAGVAVEVDGYAYHASHRQFEADRRKDVELAARGLTVLRLTWRQITEEGIAIAVRIGQALLHAAARPVGGAGPDRALAPEPPHPRPCPRA